MPKDKPMFTLVADSLSEETDSIYKPESISKTTFTSQFNEVAAERKVKAVITNKTVVGYFVPAHIYKRLVSIEE